MRFATLLQCNTAVHPKTMGGCPKLSMEARGPVPYPGSMHVFAAPTVPPSLQRLFSFGLARCSIGALLLGGCADHTPPRFAGELTVALAGDQLAATWPAASDDVQVDAYLVHVDGKAVARFGRETLQYTVEGLRERTTRTVRVTAVDAAGNQSAPLDASLAVPDRTPPRFPAGARLDVTAADLAQVTLSWPAASEEGAVRYVVLSEGREIGAVTLPTFTISRAAVDADFSAEISVQAIDDADNRSSALVCHWEQFLLSPKRREELERDGLRLRAWRASDELPLRDILGEYHGSTADTLADELISVATSQPLPQHAAGAGDDGVGGCISPCGEGGTAVFPPAPGH